jgi:hypothetical protein
MEKLERFYIYWNDGKDVSCFRLKSQAQAESIAKQYKNVVKIEKKS